MQRLSGFFFLIFLISCKEAIVLSPEKTIIEFAFLKSLNPWLDQDYVGKISGNTIQVDFPHGFSTGDLRATFRTSEKSTITINGVTQVSSHTSNDFSNPVSYNITAEDQTSAGYIVSLNRIGISPNAYINLTTAFYMWSSHYTHRKLDEFIESVHGGYWGDEFAAQAFYDFDKDGDADFIGASFNYETNDPVEIHFYRNNGGSLSKDQTVFGNDIPGFVHARQVILGDFDKNGWMDVAFAAHGFDKGVFPGEQQRILLNTNGTFRAADLPLPKGADGYYMFNHSVSSGDIDNDGDVDLFFTNNMRVPASGIFMINNGDGTFRYDDSVFPGNDLKYKPAFSSSIYDIDGDGYLDLLIAGHDRDASHTAAQGLKPSILWGNYSGKFSVSRMTELPVVSDYGVSNSISFLDYDKDGNSDILIGKTGDGAGSQPFYQGFYIQLLKNTGNRSFSDVSKVISGNSSLTGSWVVWFLPHDMNGDGNVDISTADKWYNLQWRNEGSAFVRF